MDSILESCDDDGVVAVNCGELRVLERSITPLRADSARVALLEALGIRVRLIPCCSCDRAALFAAVGYFGMNHGS